ncbi:CUB and sushi domain-containing protein 3-like [Clavelina lepadiformis]|uniref:CUB and sushi domain-containing protein 3-like n=1 Tax=Clavelina lepadiformis TaxID=159417 RepID=UPI0040417E57
MLTKKKVFTLGLLAALLTLTSGNDDAICGQQSELPQGGRIIGGKAAKSKSWPWQATLSYFDPTVLATYRRTFAGGSLINTNWILTAAHVFQNFIKDKNWEKNVIITLGIIEIPTTRRPGLPSSVQVFDADIVVQHPSFTIETFDYDVALIKVGRKFREFGGRWVVEEGSHAVEYTSYIKPVCLPCLEGSCFRRQFQQNELSATWEDLSFEQQCILEERWVTQNEQLVGEVDQHDVIAKVTGFGATEPTDSPRRRSGPSLRLNEGEVKLFNNIRCAAARKQMADDDLVENIHFTKRMLCAIGGNDSDVIDACSGDSGGPLVTQINDTQTAESCWVQIGIVSWGLGCGESFEINGTRKFYPGYYANVASLMKWIKPIAANVSAASRAKVNELVCPRNLSLIEEGRICRKPCTKDSDCRGRQKRCRCDDVCGLSCFNPVAECAPPGLFRNGEIEGTLAYGRSLTYSCDPGFELTGSRIRICRSDRKWSGLEPQCREKVCLHHEVSFATHTPAKRIWRPGDSITYECNDDYILIGNSTLNCQDTTEWSSDAPTCQANFCLQHDVQFATYSPKTNTKWRSGDSISYQCNDGYRLIGSSRLDCLDNNTWSSDPPICEENLCPHLQVEFATHTPNRVTWSPSNSVRYQCNDGYRMVGNAILVCLQSRKWSAKPPVCKEILCQVPLPPPFASISTKGRRVSRGSRVTFTCNDGYTINGAEDDSLTMTCLQDGSWSRNVPECTSKPCPNRPSPNFSRADKVQSEWKVGESVTYSCQLGYRLNGPREITCLEGGIWSSDSPTCTKITCPYPATPVSGSIANPRRTWNAFDTVRFACNRGYELIGNSAAFCSISGSWSRDPPRCSELLCSVPAAPLFGRVSATKPKLAADKTITFICHFGYHISGRSTTRLVSTCLEDRTWSHPPPVCQANRRDGHPCVREPSRIKEGRRCKKPCTKDSDCKGFLKSCQCDDVCGMSCFNLDAICDEIDPFPNGVIRINQRSYGNAVWYFCNDGFVLRGIPYRVCRSDKTWSGSTPECRARL